MRPQLQNFNITIHHSKCNKTYIPTLKRHPIVQTTQFHILSENSHEKKNNRIFSAANMSQHRTGVPYTCMHEGFTHVSRLRDGRLHVIGIPHFRGCRRPKILLDPSGSTGHMCVRSCEACGIWPFCILTEMR